MKKLLVALFSVVLIGVIVILFYLTSKYTYIETIEISKKVDGEYVTIEPYLYDLDKIKKYYMFTDFLTKNKDVKEEFECLYLVRINNADEICYDGGDYALYTKDYETLDDVKGTVKKKDDRIITDFSNIKKTNVKSRIIIMNEDFGELLKSL